jgi:hypothetical protein
MVGALVGTLHKIEAEKLAGGKHIQVNSGNEVEPIDPAE